MPVFVSPLALFSPSSSTPVDAQVSDVRAARAGDVGAFERLYRAHEKKIHALCVRLCADRVRAEHLTQDAFVRAWERLGTFRGDEAFGAWLKKVTVNVVMADLRATSRRTRRVMTTGDEQVLDSGSGVRSDSDRLDLERAIATLPETARAVFVLHDVEGYGHEEIGTLMGIAEGTSKAHLHSARLKLRERLGGVLR